MRKGSRDCGDRRGISLSPEGGRHHSARSSNGVLPPIQGITAKMDEVKKELAEFGDIAANMVEGNRRQRPVFPPCASGLRLLGARALIGGLVLVRLLDQVRPDGGGVLLLEHR